MEQTVVRIGNSVGVVIPQEVRRQMKIKLGDKVVVETDKRGQMFVIRKKGRFIKSFSITPEFYEWLRHFNKQYSRALQELAHP